MRRRDQEALARALERDGFGRASADAHAFLARTPAKLLMVQPEDVFDMAEQANLPGTVDEHPNWRGKLPLALEQWADDPRLAELAARMVERSAWKRPPGAPARIPVATYRLQLHKGFRLADATALVPYLARLGVSHVYASPFLKARPGSTHGYDVVDHNRLNPEIGTEQELDALLEALRRHGMGLVLDIVPNHMGVLHGDNPWWQDVLEKGRASPHARFFDIDWAVNAARRASHIADPSVFDFLRGVLTLDAAPPAGARRRRMVEFALRFQQLTAPVVAKGVEDTAFYRYLRLIALNEVGNDPRDFGFSLKAFHAASEDRAKHWPCTMIGSSTHDTKRSEDARARIGALSEMPSAWLLLLRRWHLANRSRRTEANGESLPTRGDEYHFYQALLGIWPAAPPGAAELEALRARL